MPGWRAPGPGSLDEGCYLPPAVLPRGKGDPAIKLLVKVVPGSSRECIVGWLGDALKVRVRAPAERGKANAAVEKLVAEALGVPRECVQIVAGGTSPRKTLEISGLSEADVQQRLARIPA